MAETVSQDWHQIAANALVFAGDFHQNPWQWVSQRNGCVVVRQPLAGYANAQAPHSQSVGGKSRHRYYRVSRHTNHAPHRLPSFARRR